MQLLFVLASLFAAAQAQFSIGAPAPGATLQAGQNVEVQIIVPINTVSYISRSMSWLVGCLPTIKSAFAGQFEISLVIGIVACGSSGCPAPSADLGEILFVGKYQSQGSFPNTLNSFENFTLVVPSDISGQASIQVQHVFVTTPPVSLFCKLSNWVIHSASKGHALPGIEYTSVKVQVGSGSSSSALNIHPNGDNSKCVGILGGTYANGAALDMYVALTTYST